MTKKPRELRNSQTIDALYGLELVCEVDDSGALAGVAANTAT